MMRRPEAETCAVTCTESLTRRDRAHDTSRPGQPRPATGTWPGCCLEARIKAAEPARVLRLTDRCALIEADTPLTPGGEVSVSLPFDLGGPTAAFGLRLRARVGWCRAVPSRLTGTLAYRARLELVALSITQAEILESALAGCGAAPLAGLPVASAPRAEASCFDRGAGERLCA